MGRTTGKFERTARADGASSFFMDGLYRKADANADRLPVEVNKSGPFGSFAKREVSARGTVGVSGMLQEHLGGSAVPSKVTCTVAVRTPPRNQNPALHNPSVFDATCNIWDTFSDYCTVWYARFREVAFTIL